MSTAAFVRVLGTNGGYPAFGQELSLCARTRPPGNTYRGNIFPAIVVPLSKGRHNMYCNACGKAMAEDDRICSRCGNMVGIPPTPKKLIRSRAERKIAGVCAGLAQYFEVDVLLVRILCVFITLASGLCPGVVTYLLAWIIVPSEPELKAGVAAQQPVAS